MWAAGAGPRELTDGLCGVVRLLAGGSDTRHVDHPAGPLECSHQEAGGFHQRADPRARRSVLKLMLTSAVMYCHIYYILFVESTSPSASHGRGNSSIF